MRSLIFLAPDLVSVPAILKSPKLDPIWHEVLLNQMQRLRGKLYLADGDIERWQLTVDERHYQPADDVSWHLLTLDDALVTGCARLHVHTRQVSFSDLGVSRCAQAHSSIWGLPLRNSVTRDLEFARNEGLRFVEAGGWALVPELRSTTEALRIALGSYAFGEALGRSLGPCTATHNHNSSGILRRLGATSFFWENCEIPFYYDPTYRCEMEVIRFDSGSPNPRFRSLIDRLRTELQSTPVVCAKRDATTDSTSLQALSLAIQDHQQQPESARAPLDGELLLQEAESGRQ
jgi:hypothetical protein